MRHRKQSAAAAEEAAAAAPPPDEALSALSAFAGALTVPAGGGPPVLGDVAPDLERAHAGLEEAMRKSTLRARQNETTEANRIRDMLKKYSSSIASRKCRERKKQVFETAEKLFAQALAIAPLVAEAQTAIPMGDLARSNTAFLKKHRADLESAGLFDLVRQQLAAAAEAADVAILGQGTMAFRMQGLVDIANSVPEHTTAEQNRPEAVAMVEEELRKEKGDPKYTIPEHLASQPRGRRPNGQAKVGNRSADRSARHKRRRLDHDDHDSDDGDEEYRTTTVVDGGGAPAATRSSGAAVAFSSAVLGAAFAAGASTGLEEDGDL